jgi:CRISPR system Cascade subunit CasE
MHLSRLVLNPMCAAVRRDLANAYELHRTLSRCASTNGSSRLLWRIEPGARSHPIILVQTGSRPDWDSLTTGGPSYLAEAPLTKPYTPEFVERTVLRFRLRANPSVKRGEKRHGINTPEAQLQWLRKKGETGGFDIVAVSLRDEGLVIARKPEHDIRLVGVTFDGRLTIRDSRQFLHVVESGVGPGKGLGFGLLSIAPLQMP